MSALRDNSSKNKAIKCNRRPFEKIPIFIVEDHNNVLEFIYRCLGARRIPFTGNKIIHFDSHPDMTIPKYMPAEFVRDREKLLTTLSIENWLMPAAYAGHIDQLIWMKPDWANQIKDGDYEFRLGDHNGFIRCDSPLEYFLSEGTYQSACHLNNQRQINLRVFTLSDAQLDYQQQKQQPQQDSDDDVDSSDMRRIEFQNCVDDANEQFILDIDLDFFSTTNPFRQILNPAIYDAVKSLFKAHFFDKPFDANATDDELMAFTIERSRFIDALETIFKQLDQNINELDLTIPDALHAKKSQIIDLIRDIKNVNQSNEIAWMTIFDAGCTFDSNDLPHHVSTEVEILQMIAMFKRFLETILYTPCIITVSRSSDDDYCPAEQVEFIQKLVLQSIYDVYGDRVNPKPILHYADEEWTV